MNWTEYFKMMEDWKRLPAYKAEPRIDSLIGFYLPQIVSDFLKTDTIKEKGIIPELPLRLGTLQVKEIHKEKKYADLSYKVDFYLLGESGKNYFIEFKTDSGSRNQKQDDYLEKAEEVKMAAIVHGILQIASATSFNYKHKYEHLISKLKELELISENNEYTGKTDLIKVIYVQPRKDGTEETVIDFECISNWLKENHRDSEYDVALSNTLKTWSKD